MMAGARPKGSAISLLIAVMLLPASGRAFPLNTPTQRLSLVPKPNASDSAELQLAIWSVDVFVEQRRPQVDSGDLTPGKLLDHVDPMPLIEAVSVIKKNPGPRGDLIRRVTLLRLLSWVRSEREVRRAVDILAGPEKAARIYHLLDRRRDPGGACIPIESEEEQLFVNATLNDVLDKVAYKGCPDMHAMLASVINKGDDVLVASKVIAEGSLSRAKASLDPQRWEICSSLWKEAYLAQADANGNPIDNGQCTQNVQTDCLPQEGTAHTPYGDAYDTDQLRQPFFEQFVCDDGWCDVRLLLRIVTKVPGGAGLDWALTYDNPKQWKNFSFPPHDYGTVQISSKPPTGGSTNEELTVKADKTFGFEDWGTTFAIYFMLRRIEMANYLADLVCCDRP